MLDIFAVQMFRQLYSMGMTMTMTMTMIDNDLLTGPLSRYGYKHSIYIHRYKDML